MWIYKNTSDNKARFVLGEKGRQPLICFGVNCSTAEPENLDRTLSSVRNVSLRKGFDGWIMLNLYPQRATNPKNMHKNNEFSEKLHKENLKHIKNIFKDYPKATVWAAWGGTIMKRDFLRGCLKDIVDIIGIDSVQWKHRGDLLKKGHPHHPLFLKKDAELKPFNMAQYLKEA